MINEEIPVEPLLIGKVIFSDRSQFDGGPIPENVGKLEGRYLFNNRLRFGRVH